MANTVVKLYRSSKRRDGAWGTEPIKDSELKNLKDLPEGHGNFYLAFYEGTHRKMPSVGRFADVAKQKLVAQRRVQEASCLGVTLPPTPEPKGVSPVADLIEKFLKQQQTFVGQDGYGAAKKSITAYRARLDFYLRFLKSKPNMDRSLEALGNYDHLMEYVSFLQKQ